MTCGFFGGQLMQKSGLEASPNHEALNEGASGAKVVIPSNALKEVNVALAFYSNQCVDTT